MAGELNREFKSERDLRILQMSKAGISRQEIARRFGISTKAVAVAVSRQLERMNQEALLSYPEVLRMELERLDTLQAAIWPLTQVRRATLPNGEEVTLEPDIKATAQVLSIMAVRSKLLGMERVKIDVTNNTVENIRGSLAGRETEKVELDDPEIEGRKLLELMLSSGVLSESLIKELLPPDISEPEDAQIISPPNEQDPS